MWNENQINLFCVLGTEFKALSVCKEEGTGQKQKQILKPGSFSVKLFKPVNQPIQPTLV